MKAYIITLLALLAFTVSAQEPEPTRQEQATALRTRQAVATSLQKLQSCG